MAETKIKKEDIELLIPASSPEVLRIAVLYGCLLYTSDAADD